MSLLVWYNRFKDKIMSPVATTPAPTPVETQDRLKELMLLIALMGRGDKALGRVKLNKLLFYADLESFKKTGRTISGRTYVRATEGPVPDRWKDDIRALTASGAATEQRVEFHGYHQFHLVPLRVPNNVFTAEEWEIVSTVIKRFAHMTGSDVSRYSHKFPGWKIARDGYPVDMRTVFIGSRVPTPNEVEYGRTLVGLAVENLA